MFKEGFVEFTSGEIRNRGYVTIFFSIKRDMEDGGGKWQRVGGRGDRLV